MINLIINLKLAFMKKFLFLFLFLVFVCSCSRFNKLDQSLSYSGVIVVDSCEYVYYKCGYGVGLAHKGNCKNHKSN